MWAYIGKLGYIHFWADQNILTSLSAPDLNVFLAMEALIREQGKGEICLEDLPLLLMPLVHVLLFSFCSFSSCPVSLCDRTSLHHTEKNLLSLLGFKTNFLLYHVLYLSGVVSQLLVVFGIQIS